MHLGGRGSRGVREASHAPFLKIEISSDYGKKGLNCVHLYVKFFIQNVVLMVSRRKNSKTPQNFPCPEKYLVMCLYSGYVPALCFTKHFILSV